MIAEQHTQKEYLHAKDLVSMGLFVSTQAVRNAVFRGVLPASHLGKRLVFKRTDIEGCIAVGKQPKSKEPKPTQKDEAHIEAHDKADTVLAIHQVKQANKQAVSEQAKEKKTKAKAKTNEVQKQ